MANNRTPVSIAVNRRPAGMLSLQALNFVAMLAGASAAPAAPDPIDDATGVAAFMDPNRAHNTAVKAAKLAGVAAEEAKAEMARLAATGQSYDAIVWAAGHMNYMISSPLRTQVASEAAAKDESERVSGVICTIAPSGRMGAVRIGIGVDDSKIAMEGYFPAHAAERVLNKCASRGRRCTVAYGAHIGADGATIALPEKTECTSKTGVCNVDIGIYTTLNERGTPLLESDIDEVPLKMAIDFRCRQMAPRCLTSKSFNVREPVGPEIALKVGA